MVKKRALRALMAGGVAAAVGLGALAGASPASAYIGTGGIKRSCSAINAQGRV